MPAQHAEIVKPPQSKNIALSGNDCWETCRIKPYGVEEASPLYLQEVVNVLVVRVATPFR
jgi:hypothetical protein